MGTQNVRRIESTKTRLVLVLERVVNPVAESRSLRVVGDFTRFGKGVGFRVSWVCP